MAFGLEIVGQNSLWVWFVLTSLFLLMGVVLVMQRRRLTRLMGVELLSVAQTDHHMQLQQQWTEERLDWQQKVAQLQQQWQQSQLEYERLKATHEQQQQHLQEKIQLLENTKQQVGQSFQQLAHEIFEQKQQVFQTQSQTHIQQLLQPMQQNFESFKQRMEQLQKEQVEGRSQLSSQLGQLKELNQSMTQEAMNLAMVLKGDIKVQGYWGEMVLERLLEASGLRKGEEYRLQATLEDDEGRKQRPDVIIELPENKQVVIDAKVSLTAFEQLQQATQENERQKALKAHLDSLKKHIDQLAAKHYDKSANIHSLEFVLLFVPIESAYLVAVDQEPMLFERGFDKRVAVVTPTTLFTTLKTIEQLWRYERQNDNVDKILKMAGSLHDKLANFVDSHQQVGRQLQQAQTAYDKASTQLFSGKGNAIRQAETLKALSGKAKKNLAVAGE